MGREYRVISLTWFGKNLLERHDVHYLIIGGFAYSFYAEPRYTKDIDILIEQTQENAKKILDAIKNFGFEDLQLTEKDFLEADQIIQLGMDLIHCKRISGRKQDLADIEKLEKI